MCTHASRKYTQKMEDLELHGVLTIGPSPRPPADKAHVRCVELFHVDHGMKRPGLGFRV